MSKTTNKFSLKCESGPCGWFPRPRVSMRRAGSRLPFPTEMHPHDTGAEVPGQPFRNSAVEV